MHSKQSVLLAKIESVYGTDPTPSPTVDALLVMDVNVKLVHETLERNVAWKFFDKKPSIKGESYAEVSFKIDMIGSGSVALAPRIGAILKAARLEETVQSGSSVTYTVSVGTISSVTLYVYIDGRLHIITGAKVANAKITYTAGKTCVMEVTMKGLYAAASVAVLPATVTYESTVNLPPVCKSSLFAYNAKTTLVAQTVEIDFGIELAKRASLNTTTGVAGFEIVGYNPKVTIDPECQIETSYTFEADLLTTPRAVAVVATRAAGNIITLNVPKFNITDIAYGDREGILIENVSGEASANSGSDAFNIVFS
jgi:hypothetical protein